MEPNFYTDEFERLLKDKSDEFRMYPSKRVWHSIYNDLHPDRKWPSITISLLLISALFLAGYWNSNLSTKIATGNNTLLAKVTDVPKSYSSNISATDDNNNVDVAYQPNQVTISSSVLPQQVNEGDNTSSQVSSSVVNTNTGFTAKSSAEKGNTSSQKRTSQLANKSAQARNNAFANTTLQTEEIIAEATTVTNVATGANNNKKSVADKDESNSNVQASPTVTDAEDKTAASSPTIIAESNNNEASATSSSVKSNKIIPSNTSSSVATVQTAALIISKEDKSWMEHDAMYNRTMHNKWKGRLSTEAYITPGIGLRSMQSNADLSSSIAPSAIIMNNTVQNNGAIDYKPALTLQTGAGLIYAATKNLRIKAGLQASFTNYTMAATDVNHPVLATLLLNDLNNGNPYIESRISTIANVPGHNNKKIHNQTTQISLPVGVAIKLAGSDKLEWYAGTTIQPTFITGGKVNLLSADRSNYVTDASLLRKWNVNAGAETYIHYKMNGFTLQAGPELRRQLKSTWSSRYTYTEKLTNLGVKIGLIKNL